uniref:Reverse transcriptase domain-containing protein n=1 Tax=Chromera velia CCMP2878 TaxID=1169474 RepID=A0A0G4H3Q6_9ALVE|eukprot:Cvel_24586.t1-p1 / transcript=Cvel_24586.t1 / gene=Cvel_24586 / organism=Chromera_velia_CCMP2878 / gene_product=Transposon Ty3-I Gag-Pol polyprotein, putative / transcript_product=Transposon Ty3-I Gag-Pol polyprotein, putative / location=Cvel_scaffold2676:21799-23837(-) / protein_length=232 / sequence_SO=supercontig / SO=protein_coding / is_pseudo=false
MESFGDAFLDLAEEIKDTSTPADLIHTFKKAIPDVICLEVNKKAPSTLEEAVEAACIAAETLERKARRVVGEYRDIFCDEIPKLPPTRSVEFMIDLEPRHPLPARPSYQLSFGELDEIRRQLDDLLAKGFIHPSVSPFAAPAFFVVKKDGSLRMCINYHAINKIMINDKYAMPRPEELLDHLHGAKIFLVLDMRQFFYQLRIRLGNEPKIAICTQYGNYEWLVMPFGICNPP